MIQPVYVACFCQLALQLAKPQQLKIDIKVDQDIKQWRFTDLNSTMHRLCCRDIGLRMFYNLKFSQELKVAKNSMFSSH